IDYLDIIDVSDPSNPTIINHYNKGIHSAFGSGIEFLNNTLYVPDGNYGLELIDVFDPSNPTQFTFCFFYVHHPFYV
ncbi:unnamed protein product, partial [marine sediment metagenome]